MIFIHVIIYTPREKCTPNKHVTVQNLRNSNEFEVWTLVVYDESLKPVLGP